MSQSLQETITRICEAHQNDPGNMMDIVRETQIELGQVSGAAMEIIAARCGTHRVEVQSVVSFYAFFSETPKGKVTIRLCNDVIDEMAGAERVAEVFEEELGIAVGETTSDGVISLEHTPCIGMCDQAPAALVNDVVVTHLSTDRAREIVRMLRENPDPRRLVTQLGDGQNAHPLVNAMVMNNIRKRGEVVFAPLEPGQAIFKAIAMSPVEVIRDITASRLRGRGGAGFPTGMKWRFAREAVGEPKYVICNADEGEPGTFKDRVILTECPDLVFEGMTIAGYAIGAEKGILYLRAEYAYLKEYLEDVLRKRRAKGILGAEFCGNKNCLNFDIQILMGAGAYVCGEETALISSCEGLRGDPKNRPPFPAQEGYKALPTTVNNVETFCCVAHIVDRGPAWFAQMGSKGSPGTKLLSVSGDCRSPGVYEVPFGMRLSALLDLCGAPDALAVQVGGASGQMLARDAFDRAICYDDLATGGSIMVFGPSRDLLHVADKFMEFFIEESCGYCTPCRVGNVLLRERLRRIMEGGGEPADLEYLEELGETIRATARCGLGQTSPNPILSTLANFRSIYNSLVKEPEHGRQASFDLRSAVSQASAIAGRESALV